MMRTGLLCLLISLIFQGCVTNVLGRNEVHENEHAWNYDRIFGEAVARNVEVLHSVLWGYESSTDDWEIELLAPIEWVEAAVEDLKLEGPVGPAGREELYRRQADPGRSWYAPRPIENYTGYLLNLTSIPYVHMLVEKEAQSDGRYRVFISKH